MIPYSPIIQPLKSAFSQQLDVLRLDLIHEEVSGNKWFKLKHNLERAIQNHQDTVITFGGAFSNHIAATAAACKHYRLNCVGIIRGEEVTNPTLIKAIKDGMQLHFVARDFYEKKDLPVFKDYLDRYYSNYYLIPEGGNNEHGMLGCAEIVNPEWRYDYVFCACGTATTYAGILMKKRIDSLVIGISVLKGENTLPADTEKALRGFCMGKEIKIAGNEALENRVLDTDCILNAYAFKGYARPDPVLIEFKKEFEHTQNIPLDYVYTTKLLYAVFDLAKKNKLKPGSKILILHSGGLQGNEGFETRYHINDIR